MIRSLTVQIDASIAGLQAGLASASSMLLGFASRAATAGRAVASGLQTGLAQAGDAFNNFVSGTQASARMLAVGVSLPLLLLGKQAVSTFSEMDGLRRGLATLEKDGGSLQKRLTELTEVAKLPGLGKSEVIQLDVSLRSAGFSADLSKRSMLAFGNALAIVGKGKNELKGVGLQLSQLATKTSGFGQDIRVIKEYAPQVSNALLAAFGTSNTEAIAKMGYTGQQVIEKIVAELAKLPKATGGPKNAFENFGDTAKNAFDALGSGIYKGLQLESFFGGLANVITKLTEKFSNLPATTQAVIGVFGLLAVALPPLIAGIGYFTTTVLPAFRAGLAATRLSLLSVSGPVAAIGIAVAAAAIIIIANWDRIKTALVNTGVWEGLKTIVKSSLGVVTSIFYVFANLFQGDWTNLWEHVKNLCKYSVNAIASTIGAGLLAIGKLRVKSLEFFGLKDLAKAAKKGLDEFEKDYKSRLYKINAPKFDPFNGFQFGGKNAKDGNNGGGGGKGDGKVNTTKASDFDERTRSYYDKVKEEFDKLQEYIDKRSAVGLKVSPESIRDLANLRFELSDYEEQLEKIKKATEAANTKPLKIRGNNLTQDLQGGIGDLAQVKAKSLPQIAANLDIQIDTKRGIDLLKLNVTRAFSELPPFFRGAADTLKKGIEDSFNNGELVSTIESSVSVISQALVSAKQQLTGDFANVLAGIGEAAGKGENPLKSALKSVLDILGGYLIQLGTALLVSSATLLAAAPLTFGITLAPGLGQQLAGAGLIVGGGVVKGLAKSTGFAAGGLVYGRTNAVIGEGVGTNARNPEVVAPLDKLRNMIGNTGGGVGRLYTEVSGNDLRIILDRTDASNRDLNGSY